jgi:hypothetical protein
MSQTFQDPDCGKSPEQLLGERIQRFADAYALKQPDRIPTSLMLGHMLAEMFPVTRQELYENSVKHQECLEKAAAYFNPDAAAGLIGGPAASKILGDQMTKWPGYGLDENGSFQFNEKEFMKPEDYDAFIADPSDFALRKYMPRAFSALQGLAYMPNTAMWNFGFYNTWNLAGYANPAVLAAFEALYKAVQSAAAGIPIMLAGFQRMAGLGFAPGLNLAITIEAPFDFMSDTLRGMRGIMLDMHKRPDKLLAAMQKSLEFQLDFAISSANAMHIKEIFIPLHRGSDGFMSLPQYEKFYWPTLKAMQLRLIEVGLTPVVFYEGVWDQRLDYLAELPKGKSVGMFQNSDIFKVKKVLGDVMCIQGGMPVSMLTTSPDEVRAWTKRLCEEVGKDGGFVMSTNIGDMEGSKPELVKVWVEATKEYGQY